MNSTEPEKKVYEILERLGISFHKYEHPPVYTVSQAEKHWQNIPGAHCKNLFLRNKKGNHHYLVILDASKRADLRDLAKKIGEDRLSFGSPKRLQRYLGLEPGAVSPFGLINDVNKEVEVIIDSDLRQAAQINFHPNVNTATIGLKFLDFEKFLTWSGQKRRFLQL